MMKNLIVVTSRSSEPARESTPCSSLSHSCSRHCRRSSSHRSRSRSGYDIGFGHFVTHSALFPHFGLLCGSFSVKPGRFCSPSSKWMRSSADSATRREYPKSHSAAGAAVVVARQCAESDCANQAHLYLLGTPRTGHQPSARQYKPPKVGRRSRAD